VAELFVKRGAKTFGFITGSEGSFASKERLRGFKSRLRKRGFTNIVIGRGNYLYSGGFKAILELKKRGSLPQAIFCANDLMALGAIDALKHSLGMRVPDDVLVAGFDDIPEASWSSYDLTTVVQDGRQMVAEAMKILDSMMSFSGSAGGAIHVLPARLVERSTTLKLKEGAVPDNHRR
jgi:DNA-binding LacI/PurR family transcriptional regulator